MASIFKYRGQWRAQVCRADGGRNTSDFRTRAKAKQWAAEREGQQVIDKAPHLKGPTQVTLAEMLAEYAHTYTVAKGGREAEFNRINHYLRAAGLPLLRERKVADGQWTAADTTAESVDVAVPQGWQSYLARRREKRARTYELIGKLAARRVSTLLPLDIQQLISTMTANGLSDSTIQKEIALLKAMFNAAVKDWHWLGFVNPCTGIKLGKSTPRFVYATREELERLYRACAECDNPYVLPLVDCAIFLTARQGSLLTLRWEEIAFADRHVFLRKTKTGATLVPLPLRCKLVLEALPRHPSGFVFPMTETAVTMAWRGVREKAGVPHLQFRDLRHLGGTYYAKRVPNAHVLREILGHKTLYTAQIYVNLATKDLVHIMDATEVEPAEMPPMPAASTDDIGQRKAQSKASQCGASSSKASCHRSGCEAEQGCHRERDSVQAAGGDPSLCSAPGRRQAEPDKLAGPGAPRPAPGRPSQLRLERGLQPGIDRAFGPKNSLADGDRRRKFASVHQVFERSLTHKQRLRDACFADQFHV